MPDESSFYHYRAQLVTVTDGDTLILRIDLGCHVAVTRKIRLLDLDTPESRGEDRALGIAAKMFTVAWMTSGALIDGGEWPFVVSTELDKDDKYGRLLGRVWRSSDGTSLNLALLESGHGRPYNGGTR